MAWTIGLFVTVEKGTPAPWNPPQKFVVRGVYRHVRNPMIVGGFCILLGEAIFFGSWPLLCLFGITAVLNVQTDEDMTHYGIIWHRLESHYRSVGIDVRRIPVRDFDPDDLRGKLPMCVELLDELKTIRVASTAKHWKSRSNHLGCETCRSLKITATAAKRIDSPSQIPISSRIQACPPGATVVAEETARAAAKRTQRYQERLLIVMAQLSAYVPLSVLVETSSNLHRPNGLKKKSSSSYPVHDSFITRNLGDVASHRNVFPDRNEPSGHSASKYRAKASKRRTTSMARSFELPVKVRPKTSFETIRSAFQADAGRNCRGSGHRQ